MGRPAAACNIAKAWKKTPQQKLRLRPRQGDLPYNSEDSNAVQL
jgi:hypothetical protein